MFPINLKIIFYLLAFFQYVFSIEIKTLSSNNISKETQSKPFALYNYTSSQEADFVIFHLFVYNGDVKVYTFSYEYETELPKTIENSWIVNQIIKGAFSTEAKVNNQFSFRVNIKTFSHIFIVYCQNEVNYNVGYNYNTEPMNGTIFHQFQRWHTDDCYKYHLKYKKTGNGSLLFILNRFSGVSNINVYHNSTKVPDNLYYFSGNKIVCKVPITDDTDAESDFYIEISNKSPFSYYSLSTINKGDNSIFNLIIIAGKVYTEEVFFGQSLLFTFKKFSSNPNTTLSISINAENCSIEVKGQKNIRNYNFETPDDIIKDLDVKVWELDTKLTSSDNFCSLYIYGVENYNSSVGLKEGALVRNLFTKNLTSIIFIYPFVYTEANSLISLHIDVQTGELFEVEIAFQDQPRQKWKKYYTRNSRDFQGNNEIEENCVKEQLCYPYITVSIDSKNIEGDFNVFVFLSIKSTNQYITYIKKNEISKYGFSVREPAYFKTDVSYDDQGEILINSDGNCIIYALVLAKNSIPIIDNFEFVKANDDKILKFNVGKSQNKCKEIGCYLYIKIDYPIWASKNVVLQISISINIMNAPIMLTPGHNVIKSSGSDKEEKHSYIYKFTEQYKACIIDIQTQGGGVTIKNITPDTANCCNFDKNRVYNTDDLNDQYIYFKTSDETRDLLDTEIQIDFQINPDNINDQIIYHFNISPQKYLKYNIIKIQENESYRCFNSDLFPKQGCYFYFEKNNHNYAGDGISFNSFILDNPFSNSNLVYHLNRTIEYLDYYLVGDTYIDDWFDTIGVKVLNQKDVSVDFPSEKFLAQEDQIIFFGGYYEKQKYIEVTLTNTIPLYSSFLPGNDTQKYFFNPNFVEGKTISLFTQIFKNEIVGGNLTKNEDNGIYYINLRHYKGEGVMHGYNDKDSDTFIKGMQNDILLEYTNINSFNGLSLEAYLPLTIGLNYWKRSLHTDYSNKINEIRLFTVTDYISDQLSFPIKFYAKGTNTQNSFIANLKIGERHYIEDTMYDNIKLSAMLVREDYINNGLRNTDNANEKGISLEIYGFKLEQVYIISNKNMNRDEIPDEYNFGFLELSTLSNSTLIYPNLYIEIFIQSWNTDQTPEYPLAQKKYFYGYFNNTQSNFTDFYVKNYPNGPSNSKLEFSSCSDANYTIEITIFGNSGNYVFTDNTLSSNNLEIGTTGASSNIYLRRLSFKEDKQDPVIKLDIQDRFRSYLIKLDKQHLDYDYFRVRIIQTLTPEKEKISYYTMKAKSYSPDHKLVYSPVTTFDYSNTVTLTYTEEITSINFEWKILRNTSSNSNYPTNGKVFYQRYKNTKYSHSTICSQDTPVTANVTYSTSYKEDNISIDIIEDNQIWTVIYFGELNNEEFLYPSNIGYVHIVSSKMILLFIVVGFSVGGVILIFMMKRLNEKHIENERKKYYVRERNTNSRNSIISNSTKNTA